MPPFLFMVASTNPVEVSSGLLSVLSNNIAAIITGTFTLLAVWATAHQGHRKRYLEWTWDKAFTAFTELDRVHREVVHQVTELVWHMDTHGHIDHDADDRLHAEQRLLTTAISQCALLSRNPEVQGRLSDLHSTTRDAISFVRRHPQLQAGQAAHFTDRFQQLITLANRNGHELKQMLNGQLDLLTKK